MKLYLFALLLYVPVALADTSFRKIVSDVNWSDLKLPFIKTVSTTSKYYKVTFFDDFRGKPDTSSDSTYCYDILKPQCTIWSGYKEGSFNCDQSHLALSDQGYTPPMGANFKAALYSLNPAQNLETLNLQGIKSLYSQTVTDRWKHINKCNWRSYTQVNWMATDYQGRYSAKMDATQVTVDPRGKGYLILSARKTKILDQCVFGGTLGPSLGIHGKSCLLKNVQEAIQGPLGLYWIDSDIKWPGIYYKKINGGCPYGGTGSVNCQVYAFAPGEISPNIPYFLMSYNGSATTYYLDRTKFACGLNTEYPNGGVVFNKLSCPIVNPGILSQKFFDPSNRENGFIQKNGVFEVKLRLPKGKGAFPAAWLMPIKGGWPYSGGEIDIVEARDDAVEVFQTFHQGKCIDSVTKTEIIYDPNHPGKHIDNGNCQNIPGAVSINFSKGHHSKQKITDEFTTRDHVYSVEWSDSKIQWYLNNVRTNMVAPEVTPDTFFFNNSAEGLTSIADLPANLKNIEAHNMPRDPFYWILNHSTWVANADLANWQEQHHYIDYVKVYAQCLTQNDFCPRGGSFVEGQGCVISGTRSRTYASVCSKKMPARTCPNGGEVAGPNCLVKAFVRPHVAPGVKYWVDANPNYPGVYYPTENGACPFGGVTGVNCWFDMLPQKLTAPQNNTVLPGVNYWVDTNPQWPGIFYAKINGKCPVGGTGSVNCQLRGFDANFLRSGVFYWVSTDPRWPGVYYHKVNGACPYGGSGNINCRLLSLNVPSFYLNPKINYWVDTNPQWPGIYYNKINNTCPFGGSGSVNCQIKAYPSPTNTYVIPEVKYWVDANPDYPGVYYAKINNSCPYGGSIGVNCQLMSFKQGVVESGVKYWIDANPLWPGVYYAPDFR